MSNDHIESKIDMGSSEKTILENKINIKHILVWMRERDKKIWV